MTAEAAYLALLEEPPHARVGGRVVGVTGAGRGLDRSLACAPAGTDAKLGPSTSSEAPVREFVFDAGGPRRTDSDHRRVNHRPGSITGVAAARDAGAVERRSLDRFDTSAQTAACAMFLAHPISSYPTGSTLVADGGWSAR